MIIYKNLVHGNGRLGRILIPLFLYQKEYLSQPVFYLSEYFEANKEEYYSRLSNISKNNDWQGWIEFFLKSLIQQASDNLIKVNKIILLYDRMKTIVQDVTNSQYSQSILDGIFMQPIITPPKLSALTHVNNRATVANILRKLTNHGTLKIIKESSGRKPQMYAFSELINLTEGKEVI